MSSWAKELWIWSDSGPFHRLPPRAPVFCLWPYGNVIRKCVFARPDLVMGTVLDPSGWQDLSKSAVFVRSTRSFAFLLPLLVHLFLLIYQCLSNFLVSLEAISNFDSALEHLFCRLFIFFFYFSGRWTIDLLSNIYSCWELIHILIVEFINQQMFA